MMDDPDSVPEPDSPADWTNPTDVSCVVIAPEPDRSTLTDLLLTVPPVNVPVLESAADAFRAGVTLALNVPLPVKFAVRSKLFAVDADRMPSPDRLLVIENAGVTVAVSVPDPLRPTLLVIAGTKPDPASVPELDKNADACIPTLLVAVVSVPSELDPIEPVKLTTTALDNVPEPDRFVVIARVTASWSISSVPEPDSPEVTVIAGVWFDPTSVPDPESPAERLNATVTDDDRVPEPDRFDVIGNAGVRVGAVSVPEPLSVPATENAGVAVAVSVPEPDKSTSTGMVNVFDRLRTDVSVES